MANLVDPAILLFVFGVLAGLLRSNLGIPQPIARFLALYLLMAPGDAALLMALAASACYIAAPAVVRHAIPEANPSLFIGMLLGLTFPFNILVGIPLYTAIAGKVLGSG